jgi:hypothetical protein
MTAKVGRRIPDAEPLPPSIWRYQLRRLGYWMLAVVAASLVAGVCLAIMQA